MPINGDPAGGGNSDGFTLSKNCLHMAPAGTTLCRAGVLDRNIAWQNADDCFDGGDQMIEWTAIGKKRRYTFANPQHALYDRMAAVKLLTGDVPVEGRLLFTLRSEFPKGKPRNVVRIDDLAEDFPLVDKARGNITAAFGDVWANVKKHAEPNPLTV